MMTWQHPSSAALPAKQRPDTTPTSGTFPLSAPNSAKASVSSPVTTAMSVSPGRPPPPSAKSTTGSREPLDQLEEPVLLAVVHLALGAGQDGIVVRQHGAARPFLVEEVAVDPADAGDEAVGRRVGDEVLGAPARPLGGDDEPAVLLEGVRVAEVLDVLPRRPAPARVPALGCRRTSRVEGGGDAGPQLLELGARSRRWGAPGSSAATLPTGASSSSIRTSTSPDCTASPTATATAATVPGAAACTTCSIFMDSSRSRTAPAATRSPGATATRSTVPAKGTVSSVSPPTGARAPRSRPRCPRCCGTRPRGPGGAGRRPRSRSGTRS